jgi:hypothetical protein
MHLAALGSESVNTNCLTELSVQNLQITKENCKTGFLYIKPVQEFTCSASRSDRILYDLETMTKLR